MSRLIAFALALFTAATTFALSSAPVSAHAGLDSTTPAEGETVDGPLGEVVLTFSQTVTPIDGGIVAAGSDGATYVPVVTADGARVVAAFDPPLAAGAFTIAWQVRSSDAHIIDGAFSFAVRAEVPATAPPPTTSVPASPTSTSPSVTTSTPTATSSTAAPTTGPPTSSGTSAVDDASAAATPPPPAPPPVPALAADGDDGARLGDVGRVLAFPAAVIALGMLVFAATAFAGRAADLGTIGVVVRVLAALVVVGSVIELLGLSESLGSWATALDGSTGRAVVARALGGLAVAIGIGRLAPHINRSLSAAVVAPERGAAEVDTRWRPATANAFGLLGAAAIVVSFAFDGHTVSEGPRLVHAGSSVLHVGAASVWAGGVVALAVLVWRRRREEVATAATEMTLRFSVTAMGALVIAAVAGVVMALMIDTDVGGYLDTAWGRTLLVKLVLVAIGAAIGAYNHFRLLPHLREAPEDPAMLTIARRTLTVEAVALAAAASVSGLLVAASTL